MLTHENPPSSDEPEAAAGEIARRCSVCRTTISAEFFVMRGLLVCPDCAGGIARRRTGRGNAGRAVLLGTAAAALSALLWYLATAAMGRQLSGLAIAAGVAVGLAVRRSSGGRGGLRYQLIAALLVYATFVVRYVPPVFGGIADAIKKQHAAAVLASANEKPSAPATIPAKPAAAPGPGAAGDQTSTVGTLKAYLVFAAIAWALVLASPFMPDTAGLLSLLSLAAGMALACGLNRRAQISGPFPSL